MPTRLLRDGLLESEAVLSLPPEGRWLYVSILLSADDYGLFEATPFKLAKRGDVKRDHVPALLNAMADADLVRLYQPDARTPRSFGIVTKFGQRMRAARTKNPLPPLHLVADQGADYLSEFNDLASRMTGTRPRPAGTRRPEAEAEADRSSQTSSSSFLDPSDPSGPQGLVVSARAATTRRTVPNVPTDALVALWHEHCAPPLPEVGVLNEARRAALSTRWREVCSSSGFDRAEGIDWFRWLLVERVKASSFLMGHGKARDGSKPWRCTWDWLMRPTNFAKVVDGNYLDTRGQR